MRCRSKTANKCLNLCKQAEMIARNKIDPLSFLLHSESPVHALETQIEKKKNKLM